MSTVGMNEMSYSVLRDTTTVETRPLSGDPVLHRVWIVCIRGAFYHLSWLSRSYDRDLPECKAYPCNETGEIRIWRVLSCCYCVNPNVAFAEVMEDLLATEVVKEVDEACVD